VTQRDSRHPQLPIPVVEATALCWSRPVSTDPAFDDLIRRVRARDEAAAAELVRSFEPAIREAIRSRLTNAHLQPLLDSMDICQSVLKSFFVRAAAGSYDLDEPEDLEKLLADMARKKLIDQVRKHRAARRNLGRVEAQGLEGRELADPSPSPSQVASARDLLAEALRRLSPEERQLAELRNQGLDWKAIAARLGGTPQARRKQLARALDRVEHELGLDSSKGR
jgi:RNA polymerase sigma factor (sigma-70 family)